MGVDEQGDFGVEFAESSEGRERDGDEIADATNIEDDLIGAFLEEAAAEESDHRMPVLPPYVRLSTRQQDRREERAKACSHRARRGGQIRIVSR